MKIEHRRRVEAEGHAGPHEGLRPFGNAAVRQYGNMAVDYYSVTPFIVVAERTPEVRDLHRYFDPFILYPASITSLEKIPR